MKLFLLWTVLLVAFVTGNAASRCPPRIKVQNRSPTCRDDYDCRKYYQICCPNAYNAFSCTYPSPFSRLSYHHYKTSPNSQSFMYSKRKASNTKYCNGVKCMPHEVCWPDNKTGQLSCRLPF